MHTCPCRISQGDVAYCSPAHARADAALALCGNQHTFYRAYWRRFDRASPPPGAAAQGRAKPLPAPPRPAREEQECVRYPVPAPESRPELRRFPGYVKQLPEPPSTWSVTTAATRPPDLKSHFSATTEASRYPPTVPELLRRRSQFSAITTTTALPEARKFAFPSTPIRKSARTSDLTSVCTTPDLDEGRFSAASSDDENEENEESDEDERPPGSPTLLRLSDWLDAAAGKLDQIQVEKKEVLAPSPLILDRANGESSHEETDLPPALPPKPKLRHRECSIHLPSPSSLDQTLTTPRVSTATARERVYDDLKKHSIFRAYFDDGTEGPLEHLERLEHLENTATSRPGSRKGHARRVSERWVMDPSAPPVPKIPEKYKAQVAKPAPSLLPTVQLDAAPQVPAKTYSIHPLKIRKLLEPFPPTPPKPHSSPTPSPSSSRGPPRPTPPKPPPKAPKLKHEDSGEMTPQEYRDSLAAESGWWEPGFLVEKDRGVGMSFVEESQYHVDVWAE
ncbi:hypothetical protein CALCODRAFT_484723 [Calocera cornea HHB12733]|uniref:Uncharacterized protein n=1 Tax=Calocera cornea HHB12733 TaxID=1353952 RepID=A0A165ESL5_9BASI|nr:hypothetical protein CALCODRAFT_484723 [Calocera cornea HHB12733]